MKLDIDYANTATNWDKAREWEKWVNREKDGNHSEPNWSFDCSFKLDYDGAILHFSSRFYPPAGYYGKGWDGTVSVYHRDDVLNEVKLNAPTLSDLVDMVETHCRKYEDKVIAAIKAIK